MVAKKKKWRKSKSSVVVGMRLSNEDVAILDRKVDNYPGEMSRSRYCGMRLHYDLTRKHARHKKQREGPSG